MEVTARGDLFIAAERGVFTTKPRPVLIVQNDAAQNLGTIVCCILSTELSGRGLFRLPIAPDGQNGLDQVSEVQVDRLFTFRRRSFDKRIGRLSLEDMKRVDEALKRWLAL